MVDRSPLLAFADRFSEASDLSAGRLSVLENPHWQQLNIRIDPGDASLLTGVLGAALPSRANTVTATATGLLAWLGPDEWLALAPGPRVDVEGDVRAAAGSAPVSVVDVSAARTVVSVAGSAARDVLAHGCALDLDPRRFPPGSCAQTRVALANVVLIAPPVQEDFTASPQFHVLVRSSFAAYLATWLLDAATEYLDGSGERIVQ